MKLTFPFVNIFQYLLKGRTVYYLHSPFLYSWSMNVLKKRYDDRYTVPEKILSACKNNNETITLNGAGARKQNTSTIHKIARQQSAGKKYGRLLLRIAAWVEEGNIIELGTSLGISTAYLACADADKHVTTFEAEENLIAVAKQNHLQHNIKNITYIQGDIDNTLPQQLQLLNTYSLAYVDANHTYEATMKYFKLLLQYKNNNSVIVFDDIYWSEEMKKAWQEIIASHDVTLTVDIFRMGIVFFNPSLSKENFRLLY